MWYWIVTITAWNARLCFSRPCRKVWFRHSYFLVFRLMFLVGAYYGTWNYAIPCCPSCWALKTSTRLQSLNCTQHGWCGPFSQVLFFASSLHEKWSSHVYLQHGDRSSCRCLIKMWRWRFHTSQRHVWTCGSTGSDQLEGLGAFLPTSGSPCHLLPRWKFPRSGHQAEAAIQSYLRAMRQSWPPSPKASVLEHTPHRLWIEMPKSWHSLGKSRGNGGRWKISWDLSLTFPLSSMLPLELWLPWDHTTYQPNRDA